MVFNSTFLAFYETLNLFQYGATSRCLAEKKNKVRKRDATAPCDLISWDACRVGSCSQTRCLMGIIVQHELRLFLMLGFELDFIRMFQVYFELKLYISVICGHFYIPHME